MMKKREALKYFQALGKTFKMKEFKKYITKKEEIDFSLEEKDGHIVYVPGKNKLEEIPGIYLHKKMLFAISEAIILTFLAIRGLICSNIFVKNVLRFSFWSFMQFLRENWLKWKLLF